MKAVVVCESWFGNTHLIAEAIAEELKRKGDQVVLVSVDEPVPDLDGIDLLVVGAPTHVHGLSSSLSRKNAIEQRHEAGEPGVGARGWLRTLPDGHGCAAAAFDTRIDKSVVLVGSAARTIARRLERHGYTLAAPAESFFVLDAAGPLEDGELARAAAWARSLTPIGVAA
jgi:Flavodoxin domain